MRLIQITQSPNGGHKNQTGHFETIPDGWAVIPDSMETPNFPFGTITSEEIDEVTTVTSWAAGNMPEPIQAPTEAERLRADVDYIAVMTNVDLGEV